MATRNPSGRQPEAKSNPQGPKPVMDQGQNPAVEEESDEDLRGSEWDAEMTNTIDMGDMEVDVEIDEDVIEDINGED